MVDGMIKQRMTSHLTESQGAAARRMVFVLCLLSSALCSAGELVDPTRPPPAITGPAPGMATDAAESQPAGLHSTIISGTRRAAIIDGKTVELGGRHGDARLVEVNEGSVVLQGTQGRQVMSLFPGVKMSSKKEMKSQSPAGKVRSGNQGTKPVAHREGK